MSERVKFKVMIDWNSKEVREILYYSSIWIVCFNTYSFILNNIDSIDCHSDSFKVVTNTVFFAWSSFKLAQKITNLF